MYPISPGQTVRPSSAKSIGSLFWRWRINLLLARSPFFLTVSMRQRALSARFLFSSTIDSLSLHHSRCHPPKCHPGAGQEEGWRSFQQTYSSPAQASSLRFLGERKSHLSGLRWFNTNSRNNLNNLLSFWLLKVTSSGKKLVNTLVHRLKHICDLESSVLSCLTSVCLNFLENCKFEQWSLYKALFGLH